MTTSKTKILTACAASVLLAVALSACGGGGGGGPATDPEPEPDPQALANAIDLAANDARRDSSGGHIGASWWRAHNIGAQAAIVSGRHQSGRWVNVIISHDDDDQLHHNIAVIPPMVRCKRPIRGPEPVDT